MSLGMVIALAMALGYPCVAPKGTATPEKGEKSHGTAQCFREAARRPAPADQGRAGSEEHHDVPIF